MNRTEARNAAARHIAVTGRGRAKAHTLFVDESRPDVFWRWECHQCPREERWFVWTPVQSLDP